MPKTGRKRDIERAARKRKAMDAAAMNGHLEVVKRLLSHGGCADVAMEGAGSGRHLELCKWLDENFILTPLLAAGAVVFMQDA